MHHRAPHATTAPLPPAAVRGARTLVVAALAYVAGVYAGLPAALFVRSRWRPRPLSRTMPPPATAAVVIAAHDEQSSIAAKLDDLAAQRADTAIRVIVASDGSTDATVAIARAHSSKPTVLDLPRTGKAGALNEAIAEVTEDVIVFTDANSRLQPDALRLLLDPFRDPEVGGVAGDQRYTEGTSGTASSERGYWSYERVVKQLEHEGGSVMSSTGALHAVRRDLVDVVPADVPDDFYLSTGVRVRGSRLAYEGRAMAWEDPADAPRAEYRRRVRIITRGLTGVRRRRSLLDVRRHGGDAVIFFVHKLARRLVWVPMVMTFVASAAMRRQDWRWRVAWGAQVAAYGAAIVGTASPTSRLGRWRPIAMGAHFCNANLAAAHACWNVATGRTYVTWRPER